MKILLLGEFSGFHKNLKEGLVELGHEVTLSSYGDGWKRIDTDLFLGSRLPGFFGKVHKLFKVLWGVKYFSGFDVVQLMSPAPFPRILGLNTFILKRIFKKNTKVFLLGAGATDQNSVIADFYQNEYKYPQLYKTIAKRNKRLWSQTSQGRKYNAWLFDKIDGYIPIMYEYAEGFRRLGCKKLLPTIPLPINTKEISFVDNSSTNKITIFHGLNREEQKGTPFIRKAMERIQKNYPEDVECLLDGNMPLDEYLRIIEKADIVVDQIYLCSTAVNAGYNLAMGKIVMGPGDNEFLNEFGLKLSPLIPLTPCEDDIYSKIEELILRKDELGEMKQNSRRFCEELHCYLDVAKKFVDVWQRNP